MLAQNLHSRRNVAAPPLHILIQRIAQCARFLDRCGGLTVIEIGCERHKTLLRESVADLLEEVVEAPPCMQNHHPWSAATFGNCQIAVNRSVISLKFSHTMFSLKTLEILYI